ncbi:restriction endonuclease subunit S [Empedobacter sp.]|uniref:restriction endonuclease subunit S n=1 Tax=Empedobacter sp. TaxID=1927715 RepID=UPI002898C9F9|nr:restriction endonuclease subunit S [Empedobacter sp.]
MSKLDELLQGVDVEWLPLEDYAIYEQPTKYLVKSKDYSNEYDIPVLTAGKTFILGYTNEKEGIYKASLTPVIIFDDFTTANKWVDFDFKAKSSAMKIIKSKDESKALLRYIYYWINSLPSDLVDGDHKRQWISNFSKKLIPIPPIEIQQEIVRVLDELTSLTNQLTTELETERQNRKKQFEFFREQMFRFEEGEIQIKPLIEIAEIGTGSRNTNEAVIDGQYPFFVRSQIPRAINEFEFDETAIITAGDGVGVGKVFHYISGKYALHQRAYRIVLKSNVLSSKYLFYYIKNNFSKYIEKISVHASVTSLRKPMFEKYPIPIPSLEEQERIVNLLDQFDAAQTAIEEELTKEIKLRTQQYEYYREKLLTFPKN